MLNTHFQYLENAKEDAQKKLERIEKKQAEIVLVKKQFLVALKEILGKLKGSEKIKWSGFNKYGDLMVDLPKNPGTQFTKELISDISGYPKEFLEVRKTNRYNWDDNKYLIGLTARWMNQETEKLQLN